MELRRLIFQELIPALIYLSDAVFSGLKVLVPILLVWKILRFRIKKPDLEILINRICFLVLLGGIVFLTPACLNAWASLSSGVEGEMDFFIILLTGSQWYKFLIPALVYGILPQLMWFRRFRTVYAAAILVFTWIFSGLLIEYLSPEKTFILSSSVKPPTVPLTDYLKKGILFIFLLLTSYGLPGRRKKAEINNGN